MSGIHPVSAALLAGFGAVALVAALAWAVHALRRWRHERREAAREEETVIDLTFMHAAIHALEEASTTSRGTTWRITVDDEHLLDPGRRGLTRTASGNS